MHNLKYYLFIVLFLFSNICFCQKSKSFETFKSLFPGKKIDSVYQKQFLNITYNPRAGTLRAVKIHDEYENFISLIVQLDCAAGGYCQTQTLYTFDKSGELIDNFEIQKHMEDCSFSNRKYTEFFGLLFYTTHIKDKINCDNEQLKSKNIETSIVKINNDGTFDETKNFTIPDSRKYANLSYKILKSTEIKKLTNEQLAEMRNEIFAFHGYAFKSSKWQKYFNNYSWYNPSKTEVSEEELNLVERKNLELIVYEEQNR